VEQSETLADPHLSEERNPTHPGQREFSKRAQTSSSISLRSSPLPQREKIGRPVISPPRPQSSERSELDEQGRGRAGRARHWGNHGRRRGEAEHSEAQAGCGAGLPAFGATPMGAKRQARKGEPPGRGAGSEAGGVEVMRALPE